MGGAGFSRLCSCHCVLPWQVWEGLCARLRGPALGAAVPSACGDGSRVHLGGMCDTRTPGLLPPPAPTGRDTTSSRRPAQSGGISTAAAKPLTREHLHGPWEAPLQTPSPSGLPQLRPAPSGIWPGGRAPGLPTSPRDQSSSPSAQHCSRPLSGRGSVPTETTALVS